MDDYLSKPFLPEELMARFFNLLERYEIRKKTANEIEKEILISNVTIDNTVKQTDSD